MSNKIYVALLLSGLLAGPGIARAGIDGTTGKIQSAVNAGSVDAIVAELERAENIPERGAFATVMKLVDHDSERVREAAGWWLGRRGVRQQVIQMAQQRLAAQDPTAARNVLDALRGMREGSTLDLIGGYVAHPLDEQSGVAGLRALGAIGAPRALALLAPALGNQMSGVRVQALRTVRELRAPVGQRVVTVGTAYVPLLKDADEGVRREAAITLGYLGQGRLNTDPESSGMNALMDVVLHDASPRVRKAAAWALGELGNGAARTALQQAMNDGDALVRSVATAAAGRVQ